MGKVGHFVFLVAVFFIFAPAAAVAAGAAPSSAGASSSISSIIWQNERLSLSAAAADLRELIAAISGKTGIPILLDEAIPSSSVSWNGEAQPIEKVLDGVLAAAGVTNYLMAPGKDNGILLVSRGSRETGIGLPSRALEVMETATVGNGWKISFFPRELVVIIHPYADREQALRWIIPLLEQKYALSLLGRTAIQDRVALRFRLLGGARVIDRIREIWAAIEGSPSAGGFSGDVLEVAVPNGLSAGLGAGRVEIPGRDLHVKSAMTSQEEAAFVKRVREVGFLEAEVEKWPFMRLGKVGCEEVANKRYFYFQGSFQLMVDYRDRANYSFENLMALFAEEGGFIFGVERYFDSVAFFIHFPDLSNDEAHCEKFKLIEAKLLQMSKASEAVLSPLGWSTYTQTLNWGERP